MTVPTWEQHYFAIYPPTPAAALAVPRFNPYTLPVNDNDRKKTKLGKVQWFDHPRPSDNEVSQLFHPFEASHNRTLAVKAVPKNHRLHPVLFPQPNKVPTPLEAKVGRRYLTLRKAVATLTHYLSKEDDATPELIYAVLWWPLQAEWGADQDGTSWLDRLWTFVTYYWSLDRARADAEKREELEEERKAIDLSQQILAGMSEWCEEARGLVGNDAKRFIMRHLVAVQSARGEACFVLGHDGRYESMVVGSKTVINRLERLGYNQIISLKNETGSYRSASEILTRCGTLVKRVVFSVDQDHKGGYIDNLDSGESSELSLSCYKLRMDLEPTFDPGVDAWLQALGGANYERLCEWLGHALAFAHGALPLLALTGVPDSGKGLLARGLAECLTRPILADGNDLLGKYGDNMLYSPFVVINENWPSHGNRQEHPADRLRDLIGKRSITIEQKYLPKFELRTNIRLLATANSEQILTTLAKGRDMGEHERHAVAQRIIHIPIPHTAAKWLKDQGGMLFTGRPGHRWITGPGGEVSDYVLAKHLFWLHAKLGYMGGTRPEMTDRLLMTGRVDADIVQKMRMEGRTLPWAIATLVKMLNEWGPDWSKTHIRIVQPSSPFKRIAFELDKNGAPQLFVLAEGLVAYAEENRASNIPDVRSVGRALKNLTRRVSNVNFPNISVDTRGRSVIPSRHDLGRNSWRLIDLRMLHETAQEYGLSCPLVARIVEGAPVTQIQWAQGSVA